MERRMEAVGVGHNSGLQGFGTDHASFGAGFGDETALPDPDRLPAEMASAFARAHARRLRRRDELLDDAGRFAAAHEGGIGDTAALQRSADLAARLKREAREVEALRVRIKAPFLAAARAVDAFFKAGIGDRLDAAAAAIERLSTEFLRRRAEEAEAHAAEQRDRLEAEAARAADAARRTLHPEVIEHALALDQAAMAAQRLTEVSLAERTRTRGHGGAVVSLRNHWTFEVADPAQVPREYLSVNEGAIRAAIRAGARDIPGVRIFNDARARVV